jgi:hypothetical protein
MLRGRREETAAAKPWHEDSGGLIMASVSKIRPGPVHPDTTGMGEDRMLDAQRSGFGFISYLLFPLIAVIAFAAALYQSAP